MSQQEDLASIIARKQRQIAPCHLATFHPPRPAVMLDMSRPSADSVAA
jgi:hypothetical protein